MVNTSKISAKAATAAGAAPVKSASWQVPSALATPTDLKPHEVRAVAEAVNPLIADAFSLYVKTKNYHWHLASSHFRDYHALFDEQAESIFAAVDVLAERVRRIFDQQQFVPCSDLAESIELAWIAAPVHGDHGLRPFGQHRLQRVGREISGRRIDVGKYGRGLLHQHRVSGGDERLWR